MKNKMHKELHILSINAFIPVKNINIDVDQVISNATQYLKILFKALEIPANPIINLKYKPDLAPRIVEFDIDRNIIPVLVDSLIFHNRMNAEWSDLRTISSNIIKSLFSARSIIINDAIIKIIWSNWSKEVQKTRIELKRWLVSKALKYGFKMSTFDKELKSKKYELYELKQIKLIFERALQGYGPGSVEIYLSRKIFERCYDSENGKFKNCVYDGTTIDNLIDYYGQKLFYDLGVRFKLNKFKIIENLRHDEFVIKINDIFLPAYSTIDEDTFLVDSTLSNLNTIGVTSVEKINPINGGKNFLVKGIKNWQLCKDGEMKICGPEGYISQCLFKIIKSMSGAFITPDIVSFYSMQMCICKPALALQVLKKKENLLISRILRDLVEEQVSIRNMAYIYEFFNADFEKIYTDTSKYNIFTGAGVWINSLNSNITNEISHEEYLIELRRWHKRWITEKISSGSTKVNCYLIAEHFEKWIEKSVFFDEKDPNFRKFSVTTINTLKNFKNYTNCPIILTSAFARRKVKKLISQLFPEILVISYGEVSPDIDINPIDRIGG